MYSVTSDIHFFIYSVKIIYVLKISLNFFQPLFHTSILSVTLFGQRRWLWNKAATWHEQGYLMYNLTVPSPVGTMASTCSMRQAKQSLPNSHWKASGNPPTGTMLLPATPIRISEPKWWTSKMAAYLHPDWNLYALCLFFYISLILIFVDIVIKPTFYFTFLDFIFHACNSSSHHIKSLAPCTEFALFL